MIIGSGSAKMSSAKIAKQVAHVVGSSHTPFAYTDLIAIIGVGHAKACVILASIELGKRLNTNVDASVETHDISEVKRAPKTTLRIEFVSGAKSHLGYYLYPISHYPGVDVLVRTVFAKAIEIKARSLMIGVGSKDENITEPSLAILSITHRIYAAADYLQVAIDTFELANQKDRRVLKRGDIV